MAQSETGAGMAVSRRGGVGLVFTLTLFTSAFLMFMVQPMFAKMALPRLGGTSAVWSLALVFFQAVLLLGYGYAHLVVRWLGLRSTLIVHVLVCCIAVSSLPIAIAAGWDEPPEQGEAAWLLALFAVSVGLPFFALSANAPLLQAWFARAGQARSGDPYFLYAASNAGSFLALLVYPFAVEPFIGLAPQGQGWSLGFIALIGLIALCGVLTLRGGAAMTAAAREAEGNAPPVTWRARMTWIVLAFLPSGLLVSGTAFITTDLASAPFLWVLPLAIYLLTFVIAFQARPLIPHKGLMSQIGLYGTALGIFAVTPLGGTLSLALNLLLCFLLMLGCHGELAQRRPAAARLTEFYFIVSLGGVLGGAFSSLAAPQLFNSVSEYPVLVIASMAVLGLAQAGWAAMPRTLVQGIGAAALLLMMFRAYIGFEGWAKQALLVGVTAVLLIWLALGRRQPAAMALLLVAVMGCYAMDQRGEPLLLRTRSFYGVLSVTDSANGRFRELTHGTTKHGVQRIREEDGTPITGPAEPRAYYYAAGPFGSAIRHLRDAHAGDGGRLSDVALVGLGVGSMLCFSQPGESWRFYEIDPQVVAIASDPRYFTLLRDCGPAAGMIVGDGRLKLGYVADGSLDLIVLDAFSSDAVPAHLMTREALALYMRKLKPGGIAIFHTSNRYLELNSVVAAAARSLGLAAWHNVMEARYWHHDPDKGDVVPTLVVVARNRQVVPGFDTDPAWRLSDPGAVAPWTDDYSDIPGAIWRRLWPSQGR